MPNLGHQILPGVSAIPSTFASFAENNRPTACVAHTPTCSSCHEPLTPPFSASKSCSPSKPSPPNLDGCPKFALQTPVRRPPHDAIFHPDELFKILRFRDPGRVLSMSPESLAVPWCKRQWKRITLTGIGWEKQDCCGNLVERNQSRNSRVWDQL
jgi:hypothetical protein